MTWIAVADSAVKIGLGALITGLIAFILSTTQHRNDRKKAKVAREFEMLKEVAGKVGRVEHSKFQPKISTSESHRILITLLELIKSSCNRPVVF
jgi:hypothetical protein